MKFQNVAFRDIEEFLEYLPDPERQMVELLRGLVFNCIPGVTEKLSYNVPFYKRRRNICFIWPSSVLWGKKKTYEGVRFGFANGHLLQDEFSWLDTGNRKHVYWKDFTDIRDVDLDLLKTFIFEAAALDAR